MKGRCAPLTRVRRVRRVDLCEKVNQELPLYAVLYMGMHVYVPSPYLHSWAVLEDAGAVKMQ